ncbi:TetR/AcrR family transcriptional regulator [Tepidibacter aestuarii]|uniref:TetR/AcrR family transcriptional regulator n=1 Tax=Tepidibacter aestuarii TaxID=2925782 RepID=UPI0020BDEE23|nr:TetR/AcrR family transcriptional regulator [Tepidibacter aestuarii]CAH2214861.1 Transcriptional regulator, TetR family [Tepidibacter aestuarii]
MPKIIKNLDMKIFDSAIKLFSEHGYKKVDMKMIAKETKIAVGTLYNYYPNKKKLYTEVITKSWESTLKKVDSIMDKDIESKEKIKQIITTLYEEIMKRQGIGRELIKENVVEDNIFLEIKEKLLNDIQSIIRDINNEQGIKFDDSMQKKLAQTILVLIITFINEESNEKDENIKFIIELLECTYK